MSLRARIMSLTAKPSGLEDSAAHIYRIGYRDARHAAAELAAEADAEVHAVRAALEGLRARRAEADAIRDELVSALELCAGFVAAYGQPETRAAVNAALARAKGQA